MTGPTAPAGWYPDPQNPAQQRYWDGHSWTEHTMGPSAPPDVLPTTESKAVPRSAGRANLLKSKRALGTTGATVALVAIVGVVVATTRGSGTPGDASTPQATTPASPTVATATIAQYASIIAQSENDLRKVSREVRGCDVVITRPPIPTTCLVYAVTAGRVSQRKRFASNSGARRWTARRISSSSGHHQRRSVHSSRIRSLPRKMSLSPPVRPSTGLKLRVAISPSTSRFVV